MSKMNQKKTVPATLTIEYEQLLQRVGKTLHRGRQRVAAALKKESVITYWEIGRDIIEHEQGGKEKADYGTNVLSRLARDLTERYGRGFSRSNVVYMRKLYMTYPNSQTLSDQSKHTFMSWKYSCFDIKRTQAKAVDILANAV